MKNKMIFTMVAIMCILSVGCGSKNDKVSGNKKTAETVKNSTVYEDKNDVKSNSEETIQSKSNEKTEKRKSSLVDYEIEYEVRDGKAYVKKFNGEGEYATIGSEYEGYDVVGIDNSAFEGSNVSSIICWADLETIGDSAFKDCTELQNFSVPSTTTIIGNHAFENCSSLENIIIWGDPDIGESAFANCVSLSMVNIGSETDKVCDHAFDGCTSLNTVIIWNKSTKIGKDAFANCTSLSNKPKESGNSVKLEKEKKDNTDGKEEEEKLVSEETSKEVEKEESKPVEKEESKSIEKEEPKPVEKESKPVDTGASGIRPEFQKAMDEYVKFFEEYCAFMKKYSESDDVMSMLNDYNSYMKQYVETMNALDEIDEGELSKEELKLYLDTMNTINKMLLDSMQ